MKIWILAGCVVLMIFLSSCAQQVSVQCNAPYRLINNVCCMDANKNGVCDDQEIQQAAHEKPATPAPQPSVVINPPQEQKPVEQPKEQKPQEQPKEQANAAAQEVAPDSTDALIAKMNALKSVSYVYEGKQIAVMGHVMRAQLTKFFKPDNEHPVNTLYIDMDTKKAKAYCEGDQRIVAQICEKDNLGPFDVDSSKYYTKTPLDWLKEFRQIKPESVDTNAQVLQSIHTDKWVFVKEGLTYTFWVDSAHGMPMRIRITSTDTSAPQYVDYLEVYFNTVKPELFQGKI